MANTLHQFVRGDGRDWHGRSLADIVAFDDRHIEGVHDFIQWLFPLREASRAVPGSPILSAAEAALIRDDEQARAGVAAGLARMTRFYQQTDSWLVPFDHNHLRITRIITAVRDLLGHEPALAFHAALTARNQAAGAPVNLESLRHWQRALG